MNMHLFWHPNELFALFEHYTSFIYRMCVCVSNREWKTCINIKIRFVDWIVFWQICKAYFVAEIAVKSIERDVCVLCIWCFNRFYDWIFAARGRLSHSTFGDKSQGQDTGTGSAGAASTAIGTASTCPIVTESRIKPRSR